jgi:hypothetical protein
MRRNAKMSEEKTIIDENGHETQLPAIIKNITIDQIALMDPKRAAQVMETRIDSLVKIRQAAIKGTQADDWVAFRDRDGNINYLLASSGATKVRKYYGISTYNFRPETPVINTDENGNRSAAIVGDAFCGLTGEAALNIMGVRVSTELFTGRGTDQDLIQAARTSLETKAVRVLAGMIRVSGEELKAAGIDVEKCRKGSGFGTSSDRAAGKVTSQEAKNLQVELDEKLTKYAGGDAIKISETLKNITANPNAKTRFAGFTSIKQLTQDWQIKQAIAKLEVLISEGGAD